MQIPGFRHIIFCLIFLPLLSGIKCFSQTDTEFWFVAPEITYGHCGNIPPSSCPGGEPIYFRVSAMELDSRVTINQPRMTGGLDTTFNVLANSTVSIDVSHLIDSIENDRPDEVLPRGIHINATNLITVYYDEDEYFNRDIFALKGKNALGTEFYTPFNSVWPNGSYTPTPYSSIDIVATEDNTVVWITPTADLQGGQTAFVPFPVTLPKAGDTYSAVAISTTAAGHLSGTYITSNNPIAVTIKDDSAAGGGCRDLIGDQLIPVKRSLDDRPVAGKEYIVMRGKINIHDPFTEPAEGDRTGERIFITAIYDNTSVSIDGGPPRVLTWRGDTMSFELFSNSHHVEATEPIMVLHASGFGCELGGAILPSIDGCTGSLEVSFTRSRDDDFYLNIMTDASAVDGFDMHYEDSSTFHMDPSWFEPVGTTGWVTLKADDKKFPNNRGGGVPQNEVVKITNSISVFHLGLIEGLPTSGCKYGYFSDYAEARGGVVVVETGTESFFQCFGDTAQLRANGGVSYSWSPTDYLSDPFIANPQAAPPPGQITYTVTIDRPCSFPDTNINVIVGIAEQVEAFFDFDKWDVCAPDTVTVENKSIGVDMSKITNVQWDFDLDDPFNSLVYDTSQFMPQFVTNTTDTISKRTIQLIVWNDQSCLDQFQRDIIIRPEITAGFTSNVSNGCHPLTVDFTNTSTGNTDRYKWTFGDGGSSVDTDPDHDYLNTGMTDLTHDVELVAISPFYCTDTVTSTISVYPYLEAAFAIDTFQGCSPLLISIDNNSAGYIEEHEWTFGDGASQSTPASTLSHTYTNTTGATVQHNLRLVVKNITRGCTDTIIKVISVFPEVTSAFTQDNTSGCHGVDVSFTNQSSTTATLYEWDFGDGGSSSSQDPVHTFENMDPIDTDYSVRLVSTSPNLCRDSSYQTITIHPYIHSEFSVDEFQGCAPFTVELQNASEGSITGYEWDWGDGTAVSTSPASTQTHPYTNTGPAAITNQLTLVTENAAGCTDTMVRSITVFPQVTSQFTENQTEGCNQLTINFTNQSSASATSFLWEFGDGGSSDQVNPTHLFQNFVIRDTTFTSRLIAVTDEDCTDTSEVDITVYSYLDADFTFSQGTVCTPFEVTFNNASVGGASYNWDFGDGSDTTVANSNPVNHTFYNPSSTTPVTNKVVLTVLNARGCPSTETKDINVQPIVTSGFSASVVEGCHPLNVSFTNSSTGALVYNWDFDNGTTSGQDNPSTSFLNFGSNDTTYNVRLVATNVQTCKDSFFVPILVHPFVAADFTIEYLDQCSPASINFNNLSVNGQQYDWTFNTTPVVSMSTATINRQFTNSSTTTTAVYPVDLTVTSPQGCTSSLSRQVSVFHNIDASYSNITEGCHPLNVAFTNTSLGALENEWDFGDNTSSIFSAPSHVFNNEGSQNAVFDVMLKVVSEDYCRDSLLSQVTVYPGPTAKFSVDETVDCSPLNITVQNLSESGDSYSWDFGDNSTPINTTDTSPVSHSYLNAQASVLVHELRLDVLTDSGCSDFITQKLSVYPSVEVDFERDSAGCSPYYAEFRNTSQRTSTYVWDFGDNAGSYVETPTHTFVNTEQVQKDFDVVLKGYSDYGCADSITRKVSVYPSPVAKFSYAPIYQYYPSSSVSLVNETNPGTWDFEWDYDNGVTSDQEAPGSYTYPDWGEYDIKLKVSNDQCSDSVVHWIKIFAPLPIAAFEPDIDTGCAPLVVSFTNNSVYGEEYQWEFDDGGKTDAFEPVYTFNEAGYYQVKLTVKGEGGEDFAFHEVQVYVLPIADFLVEPTLVMLPDQPAKVFNFTKYGSQYLWDFGDGTTYITRDTSHQYTELGVYDVSLTTWTDHGCEAYLNLPQAVTVVGKGEMKFPNVFAPSTTGPSGGEYNSNNPSNEIFFPVHDGVVDYELVIYNRWGELVFESTDVNVGWDGYCGSQRCAEAVYVWQVKVTYVNEKREILVGDITLLHKRQ